MRAQRSCRPPRFLTAAYGDDTTDSGSVSPAVAQQVNPATTSTSIGSDLNPSNYGESVTFTATVTPSTATGTVEFLTAPRGGGGTERGRRTIGTSSLAVGNHSVAATYHGDSNFAASTSAALAQTVNASTLTPTATTLSSSSNPSTVGQLVTLTAIVSPSSGTGVPTGTVAYRKTRRRSAPERSTPLEPRPSRPLRSRSGQTPSRPRTAAIRASRAVIRTPCRKRSTLLRDLFALLVAVKRKCCSGRERTIHHNGDTVWRIHGRRDLLGERSSRSRYRELQPECRHGWIGDIDADNQFRSTHAEENLHTDHYRHVERRLGRADQRQSDGSVRA
jgi:hypothetical protein